MTCMSCRLPNPDPDPELDIHPNPSPDPNSYPYPNPNPSVQDVDEFMWAPEHPRLVDYLASLPDRIAEVSATELRFGSKGQVIRRRRCALCAHKASPCNLQSPRAAPMLPTPSV